MARSRADGTVLVTGAGGHLGANLVRRLLADGEKVRVLLFDAADEAGAAGLDVERVHGDIRDTDAVRSAVQGCARIYHAAAHISTLDGTRRHKRVTFDTNVIGTRNVLAAARREGVTKVVVSGSFSALGYDLDDPARPVNETSLMYPFEPNMPYSHTKMLCEQECLRAAADGLAVVVATSTGIIGPHDYRPSRLGRTFCAYANGELRFIVPGSHEFVAVRDIVEGHVLAMRKGRSGQNYLFSTAYLSLDELLARFREFAGPQPAYRRVPSWLMLPIAEVVSFCVSRLNPSFNQRFTPGAIRRLRRPRRADISKARTELGYAPTDIGDALAEAYAFHCAQGAIRRPHATDAVGDATPSPPLAPAPRRG